MKYLLNSYPKSGSKTFASLIRNSLNHLNITKDMHLAENDNWIICQYEPLIHLGYFGSDVTKISIVRSPSDAITINTERHLLGFLGNQIYGTDLIDSSKNVLSKKNTLSAYDKEFIDHQIERYNSYTACLLKNIDSVICFTNDQIKNNPNVCLKNVFFASNVNYLDFPSNAFPDKIKDKNKYHEISIQIREFAENRKNFGLGYFELMDLIKEKQSKYHIPMFS